jgi:hypothetical protein
MIYHTPEKYYQRIHHPRPRFKTDRENVLFFMASEISRLPRMKYDDFKEELNKAIRRYPGNSSKADDTINNWRTEISNLLGLVRYKNEEAWPSELCEMLTKNEDLPEFFRYFLFRFEYPGFHIKPYVIADCINKGIYFKPAKFVLKLLRYGEEETGGRYPVNKAELTHVVFNDLRFTTGQFGPQKAFEILEGNRRKKSEYDWQSKVTRYAGDVLDYMQFAGLLVCHDHTNYYLNKNELEVIIAFIEDDSRFKPFIPLYDQGDLESKDITPLRDDWFAYVNSHVGEKELFRTDISSFLKTGFRTDDLKEFQKSFLNRLAKGEKLKAKDIGDFGEALILDHEKMNLKLNDKEDLIHLVFRIADMYVGYDIHSRNTFGKHKCVEVKTTISQKKLIFKKFHLTDNEWNAADSQGEIYFVYRLMISKDEINLFIIQNPVSKYKKGLVDMSLNKGADIMFTEEAGEWEDLLLWED